MAEPNFNLFTTDFDFFLSDELLLETDFFTSTQDTETLQTGDVTLMTEETKQTEQTERNEPQLDDEDVNNFIVENRNKNTTKKTHSDLNVFYRWAKSVNETRSLEEIPENELDKVLAHFFLKVRKQNGDKYEPDSLTAMLQSFDRLLREQGKQYSLLTDRQFTKAREALCSKRKQ